MNLKVFQDFLKLIVIVGGVALAILFAIKLMPEKISSKVFPTKDVNLISLEDEMSLGDLIAEYIVENGTTSILENETVDSALWVIKSRLLKNLDSTQYDYTFKIIDSPDVNAFAIPGGRIYIYKGILEFADNPEQLAAVLAHEIGHVENKHVVDKLLKEFGLTFLFSVISGGDATIIADLWHSVISSSFDRKQEKEADEFAFELLEKAKISPVEMATFFKKLNSENLDYNQNLELIMSHPHNNSRIKEALKYKTKSDFIEEPILLDWNRVKKNL